MQVSSDYVFDGTATSPYLESAPTGPRSAYGRSKLAGELAVAEGAPGAHAIVRTAWLFGAHGGNFVATMLRLARERDELTVVDDQIGCPTFAGHLAEALVTIAERRLAGVRHVAGGGACSWYDLAAATFAATGADVSLRRGSSADLDRPAPRPAYSVLRTERSGHARPAAVAGRSATPTSNWESPHEAARLRRSRLHRLELRPPARRRARRRRSPCSTS